MAAATSPAPSEMGRRPTSSISEFMLDARNPYFPPVEQQGGGGGGVAQGTDESAAEDAEVKHLLAETRLWRLANTAQWVAWGIVQAKVPGMPDFDGSEQSTKKGEESGFETPVQEVLGERAGEYRELIGEQEAAREYKAAVEAQEQQNKKNDDEGGGDSAAVKFAESEGGDEQEEEFDYLGYAQHRAMFFWGDALRLGLVKADELPEELKGKVKMVSC